MPELIFRYGFHQSIQLFIVEDTLGLARQLGRCCLISGIGGQQPFLRRCFQSVVEDGVNAAHSGRRDRECSSGP